MAAAGIASLSCLLLVCLAMVCTTQGRADIRPSCLRCLCEAVSGGPHCVYGAPSSCHDGVCGPYAITLPYWQDAGRPTVGLENRISHVTYQNCALDITCAEATIRGYMNRFHQDCNGDGVEDCFDYAAIHYQGGYSCHEPLSVPARNVLTNCLQREGPGEPEQPPVPDPVPPFPYPPPEQQPVPDPVPPFPYPPPEQQPVPDPVPPFPYPPPEQQPIPDPVTPFPYPIPEQPENVDDNNIQQPTTPPAIDIRLGDD